MDFWYPTISKPQGVGDFCWCLLLRQWSENRWKLFWIVGSKPESRLNPLCNFGCLLSSLHFPLLGTISGFHSCGENGIARFLIPTIIETQLPFLKQATLTSKWMVRRFRFFLILFVQHLFRGAMLVLGMATRLQWTSWRQVGTSGIVYTYQESSRRTLTPGIWSWVSADVTHWKFIFGRPHVCFAHCFLDVMTIY